jgi:polygalacturonase
VAFPETVFNPLGVSLLSNINLWLAEMTINPTSKPMVYDLSQFMIDGIIHF